MDGRNPKQKEADKCFEAEKRAVWSTIISVGRARVHVCGRMADRKVTGTVPLLLCLPHEMRNKISYFKYSKGYPQLRATL